jgi:hypothetical protein
MRRYRTPLLAVAILLGLTTTYWLVTWINLGGKECYRVIETADGPVWVQYECGGGGGDHPFLPKTPDGGGEGAGGGGGGAG